VSWELAFAMTLGLSTLFSMAGAGAGIAVIPLLHFLGVPFDLAKATGLLVGFSTTVTSSLMNWRRGVLKIRALLPLALTLPIFAPLGAQLSRHVDPELVKLLFALFLIFSAGMMLLFRREARAHLDAWWVMGLLGAGVGTGRYQPRPVRIQSSVATTPTATRTVLRARVRHDRFPVDHAPKQPHPSRCPASRRPARPHRPGRWWS
jgi:hypothetical protein